MNGRGMTLVEVLMVVAIIGILATISVGFGTQMVRSSRVNGAAKTVNAAVGLARQRAITTQCAHFVEVNGLGYAGPLPDKEPYRPASVAVVRKADCDSLDYFFEAGDHIVDSENWDESSSRRVEVRLPAGVVSGDLLEGHALVLGFDRFGRRSIFVDDGADFVENVDFAGAAFEVGFRDPQAADAALQVVMQVRPGSGPRLQ